MLLDLGVGSIALLIGYLLGSTNFAVVYCKIFKKPDVRTLGSGNAGMTNVLRNYGKKAAAFTALGDVFKGIAAALIGTFLFSWLNPMANADIGGYVAAAGAIIGHIYPLYFGFKGGKAILVSFGAIIILVPYAAISLLLIFLVILFFSKIISLASISVALLFPFVTAIWKLILGQPVVAPFLFSLGVGLYITWLHRANIIRLKAGTEPKISTPKK